MPLDIVVTRATELPVGSEWKRQWGEQLTATAVEKALATRDVDGDAESFRVWTDRGGKRRPFYSGEVANGHLVLHLAYGHPLFMAIMPEFLDEGMELAKALSARCFEETAGVELDPKLGQDESLKRGGVLESFWNSQMGTVRSMQPRYAEGGAPLEFAAGPIDLASEFLVLGVPLVNKPRKMKNITIRMRKPLGEYKLCLHPMDEDYSMVLVLQGYPKPKRVSGHLRLATMGVTSDRKRLVVMPDHNTQFFDDKLEACLACAEVLKDMYPSVRLFDEELTDELIAAMRANSSSSTHYFGWWQGRQGE